MYDKEAFSGVLLFWGFFLQVLGGFGTFGGTAGNSCVEEDNSYEVFNEKSKGI